MHTMLAQDTEVVSKAGRRSFTAEFGPGQPALVPSRSGDGDLSTVQPQ